MEIYIQLQACSRWGLAPLPSTKGTPRLCAPGWPVPNELQRNSQRCNKRTCHVKADSNNLLLNLNAIEEIEYAHYHQSKDEATVKC